MGKTLLLLFVGFFIGALAMMLFVADRVGAGQLAVVGAAVYEPDVAEEADRG